MFVQQTALEDRVEDTSKAEGKFFPSKDPMPLGKGGAGLFATPQKTASFPKLMAVTQTHSVCSIHWGCYALPHGIWGQGN